MLRNWTKSSLDPMMNTHSWQFCIIICGADIQKQSYFVTTHRDSEMVLPREIQGNLVKNASLCQKGNIGNHPLTIRSCCKNPCKHIGSRLNCQAASARRNAMDDKFFADLHEGLLVHRLYLMSGTEVLDTSP